MSTKLGNVNLFVRDIERSKRFFIDAIGLVEDLELSAPPSFILLKAGGCNLTLQDGTNPGANFETAASIELGFEVDDLEAVRSRLEAWDIAMSDLQQMDWGGGFDARDPDGHRLSIFRYGTTP